MSDAASVSMTIDDCWNRIGVWRRDKAACPVLEQVIHCRNCDHYSAAGRQILQRELPPGYREEWTQILAARKAHGQMHTESIVIFRLGDEWLGIPSRIVREITSAKAVRRLPHIRKNIVKGLVNIRGELQICVSLGSLLEVERGAQERRFGSVGIADRMILVAHENNQYVFPVTEVHGLYRHQLSDLQPTPATIAKSKATYTKGVLNWGEHHVASLDTELLFHALNKGLT